MFREALFVIAQTWKRPKCPLVGEWVSKLIVGEWVNKLIHPKNGILLNTKIK